MIRTTAKSKMFAKAILFLLGRALILQCSHANDVMTKNDTSSKVDPFEELSSLTTISPDLSSEQLAIDKLYYDRMKLIFRSIDEFYFLTYDVIRAGKKLFEDVLVDLQNKTTIQKTTHLNAKISELTAFNNRVDNFRPREDYYVKIHIEALKDFFDQLDALNATAIENPNNVDIFIDSSLRTNGLQSVKQAVILKLTVFGKKFSKQLNEFEESLSGREAAAQEHVKVWLLQLHDLKTTLAQFSTM